MSEWTDATSEAVSGSQSPRDADLEETEDAGEVDAINYPDPDDDCLGPDDPGVGPWTMEFDD
jgi:hypothetical protein